jgi:hypothetical protein
MRAACELIGLVQRECKQFETNEHASYPLNSWQWVPSGPEKRSSEGCKARQGEAQGARKSGKNPCIAHCALRSLAPLGLWEPPHRVLL